MRCGDGREEESKEDGPTRFQCEGSKFESADRHTTLDKLCLVGIEGRHGAIWYAKW